MVDVPALILAGGLGTRLRSVLTGIPKVLAPVGGRPFLSYLLDQLQAAGVRESLCSARAIAPTRSSRRSALATRSYRCGIRPSPGRSAQPARSAKRFDWFEAERVLVLNGDSYIQSPLEEFHRGTPCTSHRSRLVAPHLDRELGSVRDRRAGPSTSHPVVPTRSSALPGRAGSARASTCCAANCWSRSRRTGSSPWKTTCFRSGSASAWAATRPVPGSSTSARQNPSRKPGKRDGDRASRSNAELRSPTRSGRTACLTTLSDRSESSCLTGKTSESWSPGAAGFLGSHVVEKLRDGGLYPGARRAASRL